MRYPGLLGPSYRSASYLADDERTVNFYLEKNESPNAPSPYCLLPTPGFEDVVTVPEGPIRGACVGDGVMFFVSGYRLYEWNGVTATARGTVAADPNPATLCWNGPAGGQIFITSGDLGYCYDTASHVLANPLASGATMGAYLDGYFLALDAATGALQISDLLDGTVWDPTQVALRSGAPDPFIAMTVIERNIWLSGNRTSEPWYNAGSFPYPFEPIPNTLIEYGTAAPFSSPRDVSPLIWLTSSMAGVNEVRMVQGYSTVRISTHAIEKVIASYEDVSTATSISYQEQGHAFYLLTFPDDATWAYDVTEGAWHERGYWNTATSTYEPIRVRTHVVFNGQHLVGDRSAGMLYRMGLDLYTDVDGAAIRRMRQPPRVSAPGQVRFTVPSIQLLMDVGVGQIGDDDDDPEVNPMAMLQTSRDGGRTWGAERWAAIGKIGEYNTRVVWTQCGQARNRVDRFTFSAAVPIRIADGEIEIRVGSS